MKPIARLVCALLVVAAAGCRTCPIESCHVRKVHLHNGVKYRGQPLWKMQNPAIGQKIEIYNGKSVANPQDKSRPLK